MRGLEAVGVVAIAVTIVAAIAGIYLYVTDTATVEPLAEPVMVTPTTTAATST